MVRSCARRNFAAETTFMALVICRVFTTLRIRRRMSRMLAILVASTELLVPSKHRIATWDSVLFRYRFPLTYELLLRLFDYVGQLRFQTVIESFLFHDCPQQAGIG